MVNKKLLNKNKKVFIRPMSPKLPDKREKREREREPKEKSLPAVFKFYSVDFRERF